MRRVVWLAVLTGLFVGALTFTGFLRAMAHHAPGMDPVKFAAQQNAQYWRDVATELVIYVAACIFVVRSTRKT